MSLSPGVNSCIVKLYRRGYTQADICTKLCINRKYVVVAVHGLDLSVEHYRNRAIRRFWTGIVEDRKTGCWIWSRGSSNGYGGLWWEGRQIRTHHVSWIIHNGSIPCGKKVCHKCDNPPCVNPAHLFLGMQKENMEDMARKGRHHNVAGEANPRAKLTITDVITIRKLYKCGIGPTAISKKYKVGLRAIWKILMRQTWSKVA